LGYSILTKPFDTGWKVLRTASEGYRCHVKEEYNGFVNKTKTRVDNAFWMADVSLSWLLILFIFLLKDSMLFWLWHIPCTAGSCFIRFAAQVIHIEACIWNRVDIFTPAWYFVDWIGSIIQRTPRGGVLPTASQGYDNQRKRGRHRFTYHGKRLKHGRIPIEGPNCTSGNHSRFQTNINIISSSEYYNHGSNWTRQRPYVEHSRHSNDGPEEKSDTTCTVRVVNRLSATFKFCTSHPPPPFYGEDNRSEAPADGENENHQKR